MPVAFSFLHISPNFVSPRDGAFSLENFSFSFSKFEYSQVALEVINQHHQRGGVCVYCIQMASDN